MIKTIKVKRKFTFRELMEYIIQNDVSGEFESCEGRRLKVDKNGAFEFGVYLYDDGETYEVEVEEEITEDTVFDSLVSVEISIYNGAHYTKVFNDTNVASLKSDLIHVKHVYIMNSDGTIGDLIWSNRERE